MEWMIAAFTMGFLGSLHCLGMCGPIALALPLNRHSALTASWGILLYTVGRILTYVALGTVLAFTGQSIGWFIHSQYVSLALGGFLLLGFGLYYLKPLWFYSLPSNKLLGSLKKKMGALFRTTSQKNLFIIGLLNGLLPCGLLYLALAGALTVGQWWQGGVFMASFGVGTAPALFAAAFAPQLLKKKLQINYNKVVPIAGLTLALLLLLRGMNLGIPYLSPEIKHAAGDGPHPQAEMHCCEAK